MCPDKDVSLPTLVTGFPLIPNILLLYIWMKWMTITELNSGCDIGKVGRGEVAPYKILNLSIHWCSNTCII